MKVLIVDDNEKSRKILRDLLKIRNIEIVEAKNAQEAIERVSPEFKFCILDIKLPDLDGYEVARRIKEKYPRLPLIAHTASVLKAERDKLLGTNLFETVILKPIQLQDFNDVIERFVK